MCCCWPLWLGGINLRLMRRSDEITHHFFANVYQDKDFRTFNQLKHILLVCYWEMQQICFRNGAFQRLKKNNNICCRSWESWSRWGRPPGSEPSADGKMIVHASRGLSRFSNSSWGNQLRNVSHEGTRPSQLARSHVSLQPIGRAGALLAPHWLLGGGTIWWDMQMVSMWQLKSQSAEQAGTEREEDGQRGGSDGSMSF